MIEALNEEFKGSAVSVSVPSLRVEDVLKDLPLLISKVKKSGLTFAPEAGSENLRKAINKNIDIGKLFEAVSESFRSGWRRVKLYFMVGLPSEKDEDVLDIAKLSSDISDLKRRLDGRPCAVTASINAFVPKPHTPFQREAMERLESLERKKALLKRAAKPRSVELDFHSFEASWLEAVFSRGDRRLAAVIHEAWKAGSRFDGWQEFLDLNAWLKAFEKMAVAPHFYANRRRDASEILPWDFIQILPSRSP